MNTRVHIFVWKHVFITIGYIATSVITGSYDNSILNFSRNCQIVFHISYTIWHSKPATRKGFNISTPHHLLFSIFNIIAILVSNEAVSHCGFDLYFPYGQWGWASFTAVVLKLRVHQNHLQGIQKYRCLSHTPCPLNQSLKGSTWTHEFFRDKSMLLLSIYKSTIQCH